MKKLFKLSFVLLFITTLGCGSDSVDCTTPPVSIMFEFIDKDSGENLFANGTFDAKQAVTVTDLDSKKVVETSYLKSDNSNILTITTIGWQTGTFNYSIAIGGKNIFESHVTTQRTSNKDCSTTSIKTIEIKNAEFEFDKTTGIYKIFISTEQ